LRKNSSLAGTPRFTTARGNRKSCRPGEIPQSYGLDRTLIEGAPHFAYRPTAGDVVIFNPRNPHEIGPGTAKPGGSRVSIGSFVVRMPDNRLVLWA